MTSLMPAADRLVHEALAKSGLLWITSAAGSAPAWHVAVDGVAYTVAGPGEQNIPAHEGRVEVVTRSKETRARLATFEADADVVTPQDADWEAATFALKAGRLNAPAHDVVARWQQECRITRYVPDAATVDLRGERLAPPAEQTPGSPSEATATPSADAPTTKGAGTESSSPTADLGTAAPGEPRPAAAAAEREHRSVERAEASAPAAGESGEASSADRVTS